MIGFHGVFVGLCSLPGSSIGPSCLGRGLLARVQGSGSGSIGSKFRFSGFGVLVCMQVENLASDYKRIPSRHVFRPFIYPNLTNPKPKAQDPKFFLNTKAERPSHDNLKSDRRSRVRLPSAFRRPIRGFGFIGVEGL